VVQSKICIPHFLPPETPMSISKQRTYICHNCPIIVVQNLKCSLNLNGPLYRRTRPSSANAKGLQKICESKFSFNIVL
jgi:hypothetical protein